MPRVVAASIGVLSVLLVVGCGSPTKARAGDPAGGTGTNRGTSATSAAPSATPIPGTVPVDQIPPGRPASWIPAGVTTTAPWKEPGDVVPRFTPVMFDNTPAGAFAAAQYYVIARNWAFATLDPTAFLLVCESSRCKDNGRRFVESAAKHEHIRGARHLGGALNLLSAPAGTGSDWVVRVDTTVEAGQRISASGSVIETQKQFSQVNDLYMRWNGKRWLVHEDALGR